MIPEQKSAEEQTKNAWYVFNQISTPKLLDLLDSVGMETNNLSRNELIALAIINWFDGDVPDFVELDRLKRENSYDNKCF